MQNRGLNLAETMAEVLIDVFDIVNGVVGRSETTDMFDAERQTHCAAPQPVYNTGKLHSLLMSALIVSRAADVCCSA